MMKIESIAFVGYPVTNLEHARNFYEGVLGLKPTMIHGTDEGAWVEYDIGVNTLAISNISKEWLPSSSGPSVALEVDDFEKMINHLRSNHVKFFLEPFETPVCRMAVIADPDKNSLMIHKRNHS